MTFMKQMMNGSLTAALAAGLLLFAVGCGDNNTNSGDNSQTSGNNQTSNNQTSNNSSSNNQTANNSTSANQTANNSTSANNTASNMTANNSAANMTSNNSTSANNTSSFTPVAPYDGDRVMACSDGGFTECFENADCMDSERCEDIGDGAEVPCCVPGPRGELPVGEVCEGGEIQCQTGICIGRNDGEELCTKSCQNNADCPESQPECQAIPFTPGSYCVEASE